MTGAGVTVDSDDVLRDQLEGWRGMARSILTAAGMPAALVARLEAATGARMFLHGGGEVHDRDTDERHTLTPETRAALELLTQCELIAEQSAAEEEGRAPILRDRNPVFAELTPPELRGRPVRFRDGIAGGLRLMMLREAMLHAHWSGEEARRKSAAHGKLGGRPPSSARNLARDLKSQLGTWKQALAVMPKREGSPTKWADYTIELTAAGFLVAHPATGVSRKVKETTLAGYFRAP